MTILSLSDYKTGLENDHEIISIVSSKPADLIIEREYNDGREKNDWLLENTPAKKAWWCIDAHTNLLDHVVYSKHFDYVFCAQSWFIPILQRETRAKVFYLPLCHSQTIEDLNQTIAELGDLPRDIMLSFVGNIRSAHVDRQRHLLALKKDMGDGLLICQAPPDEMLKIFRQSMSVFNCSINNDLNFRVFEAMAMGTIVITDNVTDLDSIKGLREMVTTYDKRSDLSDLEVFTSNVSVHDWIKDNHTVTHRYKSMLEMIQTGVQVEF